MPLDDTTNARLSRRRALAVGAGAVGSYVLVACSDAGSSPDTAAPSGSGRPSNGTTGSGGGAGGSGGSGGQADALVAVDDIPVGGAVSAEDASGDPLIVSRPTQDKVVAFSAICTHMGCTVAPDGDILRCPCHGSTYDIATGDNTGGPAPKPLPGFPVSVKDGEVVAG